jgi:phosphoribosyl-AMP cyclohydrolase
VLPLNPHAGSGFGRLSTLNGKKFCEFRGAQAPKLPVAIGLDSGILSPDMDKQTGSIYEKLKFNAEGLIPAIVQEQSTGRVLMMAWMNRASLESTIATGKTHFWSRSRQKFWMKGETSGHTQAVKDIAFDCDGDTLLIRVEQIGAACHEGYQSCFFRSVAEGGKDFKITEAQLETPEKIYGKK